MKRATLKRNSKRSKAEKEAQQNVPSAEVPPSSEQPRRKPSSEENALTAKNYRLAKELSDLRVRHREECRNVTRLTMENMNLASRCRDAISHVTMLKKELAMHQRRASEALAMQRQQTQAIAATMADNVKGSNALALLEYTQSRGIAPSSSLHDVAAEMDRMDRILAAHNPPPPPPPPPIHKVQVNPLAVVVQNSRTDIGEEKKTQSIDETKMTSSSLPYTTFENIEAQFMAVEEKIDAMPTEEDESKAIPIFPLTASPKLLAKPTYNDVFPSDITADVVRHPRSADRRKRGEFNLITEQDESSTGISSQISSGPHKNQPLALSSIDAFEASFNTKFPDSFSPTASREDDTKTRAEIYNPFFPSPMKNTLNESDVENSDPIHDDSPHSSPEDPVTKKNRSDSYEMPIQTAKDVVNAMPPPTVPDMRKPEDTTQPVLRETVTKDESNGQTRLETPSTITGSPVIAVIESFNASTSRMPPLSLSSSQKALPDSAKTENKTSFTVRGRSPAPRSPAPPLNARRKGLEESPSKVIDTPESFRSTLRSRSPAPRVASGQKRLADSSPAPPAVTRLITKELPVQKKFDEETKVSGNVSPIVSKAVTSPFLSSSPPAPRTVPGPSRLYTSSPKDRGSPDVSNVGIKSSSGFSTPPAPQSPETSKDTDEPKRPEKSGAAAARARYEKALQPKPFGGSFRHSLKRDDQSAVSTEVSGDIATQPATVAVSLRQVIKKDDVVSPSTNNEAPPERPGQPPKPFNANLRASMKRDEQASPSSGVDSNTPTKLFNGSFRLSKRDDNQVSNNSTQGVLSKPLNSPFQFRRNDQKSPSLASDNPALEKSLEEPEKGKGIAQTRVFNGSFRLPKKTEESQTTHSATQNVVSKPLTSPFQFRRNDQKSPSVASDNQAAEKSSGDSEKGKDVTEITSIKDRVAVFSVHNTSIGIEENVFSRRNTWGQKELSSDSKASPKPWEDDVGDIPMKRHTRRSSDGSLLASVDLSNENVKQDDNQFTRVRNRPWDTSSRPSLPKKPSKTIFNSDTVGGGTFQENLQDGVSESQSPRFPLRRGVKHPISYAEPSLNSKLRRGDVYFPKVENDSSKDPLIKSNGSVGTQQFLKPNQSPSLFS